MRGRALGADTRLAWILARKLNEEMAVIQRGAKAPGTVSWLFDQFFETERFKGLAHSTKVDYRWLAKCLGAVKIAGDDLAGLPAPSIKARHADAIVETISAERGHATAHYCARFARRIWKWAKRKEFVTAGDNPWAGMEMKSLPQREQRWTPEQVELLKNGATAEGFPSVALATLMAYCFAHRKVDVLTITWRALEEGQRKTSKTSVVVPVVQEAYPELDAALKAEKQRQKDAAVASTHPIVCENTGRPWHPDTFTHEVRRIMDKAGLPRDLQFRDLRATALTEMKDGGADILDMNTHSGHQTVSQARRYARRTAEQFTRAAGKRVVSGAKKAPQ